MQIFLLGKSISSLSLLVCVDLEKLHSVALRPLENTNLCQRSPGPKGHQLYRFFWKARQNCPNYCNSLFKVTETKTKQNKKPCRAIMLLAWCKKDNMTLSLGSIFFGLKDFEEDLQSFSWLGLSQLHPMLFEIPSALRSFVRCKGVRCSVKMYLKGKMFTVWPEKRLNPALLIFKLTCYSDLHFWFILIL